MIKVVTIGRQYGSGGHDIGKLLAEKLGYAFYDKKLVEIAAKDSNISDEAVAYIDEKATSSLLYSLVSGSYSIRGMNGPLYYEMPLNDKLFIAQSNVIKNVAAKENSVIVGRCADYVLEEAEDIQLINIFIYAPLEERIKRIAKLHNITEKQAKDKIIKSDKQRKTYYNYYSNLEWGKMSNYDFCINSAKAGVEKSAEIIADFVRSISQ